MAPSAVSRKEEYLLPDAEREVQRLTDQDALIVYAMNNKRIIAPLDTSRPGLKILDSGTADGLFLRGVEKELTPPFSLVGTDVMQSFMPPREAWDPNTTFRVQSVADPWPAEFHNHFDLVHQRMVLAGTGKSVTPREAVRGLAACVAPGGWIQLGEIDLREPAPGAGQAMRDAQLVMRALFDAVITGGHDFANSMASWLREDGFEEVTEVPVEVDVGLRCRDAALGERGANVLLQSYGAVLKAAQMFEGQMKPETTQRLEERLEGEVKSQGATYRILFVIGRKPNKQ